MMTSDSPRVAESAPAATPTEDRFSARRMTIAAILISTILLSVNAFVCATFGYFLDLPGWIFWQVMPGILPLAFVAVTLSDFRHSNPFPRILYAVSAAWLGVLNYAFFAALACWILALVGWLAGWPVPLFNWGVVLFSAALVTSIYGLVNAAWLRITRIDVRLPNLPSSWKGRTLALVTDIHLGRISGPGFLERIIARLRTLQPDAVLISGDMFDGTTRELDRLVAPWREYSAPRGIFYVTGNHDEFEERTMYLDAARRVGIRVLNNEKVDIDGLQLVGVHDSESHDVGTLRRILREAEIDPQQPSILLAHQPSHLSVVEEEGISLQVSGHTHRGQMWPWTLLVGRIYGPFAYGLHRLRNLQVYTSSGAGLWGPPLRVGTKAEIVLIRLE